MLILSSNIQEVFIQKKVGKVCITVVSICNLLQETRTDDTAITPDRCDICKWQVPVVFFRGYTQLSKSLCV
ncbi:Uncharacterised protein [Streptococcus pneumoniae]|nr:Uncharacterised protein [Streptococcus pneumoniae]